MHWLSVEVSADQVLNFNHDVHLACAKPGRILGPDGSQFGQQFRPSIGEPIYPGGTIEQAAKWNQLFAGAPCVY